MVACRSVVGVAQVAGIRAVDFLSARDPNVCNRIDDLLPGGMYPTSLLTTKAAPTSDDATTTLFGDDLAKQERLLSGSDAELAATLRTSGFGDPSLSQALLASAARACIRSHAPYSGCRAGIALQLTTGAVVWGASIENVAFNPGPSVSRGAGVCWVLVWTTGAAAAPRFHSRGEGAFDGAVVAGTNRSVFVRCDGRWTLAGLPPLQCALIHLIATVPAVTTAEALTSLVECAVLVEGGAGVGTTRWEARTRQLLGILTPDAILHTYTMATAMGDKPPSRI